MLVLMTMNLSTYPSSQPHHPAHGKRRRQENTKRHQRELENRECKERLEFKSKSKGKGKSVAKEERLPATMKQEDDKSLCEIHCQRPLFTFFALSARVSKGAVATLRVLHQPAGRV